MNGFKSRRGSIITSKHHLNAVWNVFSVLLLAFLSISAQAQDKVSTFQGSFPLDQRGAPEPETIQALYDEMDYQRAVQAYLWAMPQVVVAGSHKTNQFYGATEDLDVLHMYKDPSVYGMLTPNTIVKYVINFYNLEESGPMVLEMPGGRLVGIMMDYQMRWVTDLGLVAKAGPSPEKVVFIGPNQNPPDEALSSGWRVERVRTKFAFLGIRVLEPVEDAGLEKKIRIYPWSKRNDPPKNRTFQAKPGDKTYYMATPRGMAYWEQLYEIVQQEPVLEVDRYFMSHLQAIGIEKGKPFSPTKRQIHIMERAAFIGEKMAMTTSFAPRSDISKYRDDTKWVHPLTLHPHHNTEFTQQFEERVDWTYEAYGLSPAMKAKTPGKGSTYLGAYRDSDENWLDGGKNYKFTVAPDPPAAQFWASTVYDFDKRSVIQNGEEQRSEISTFTEGLQKNSDGSVDIYFGPSEPTVGASNWIKTNKGEYWFSYFRLYAPTETYFDRSWPMNDIEKVE